MIPMCLKNLGYIEEHNMGDFLIWLLDHKMECFHICLVTRVTHYFLGI
jgi:hypothetical protein